MEGALGGEEDPGVRALAAECCDGRLLLVQEGGYAISYAAYCLHANLDGVLGRELELQDPLAYMREDDGAFGNFIADWQDRHAAAIKSAQTKLQR